MGIWFKQRENDKLWDRVRSPIERARWAYERGEIGSEELERRLNAEMFGWPVLGHTANCGCKDCLPPNGEPAPWRQEPLPHTWDCVMDGHNWIGHPDSTCKMCGLRWEDY